MASTFDPGRGAFKGVCPRALAVREDDAICPLNTTKLAIRGNGPMTIKVGDKLPSVTLTQATAEGPKPVTTDEFFKGKKVALFALPAPLPRPARPSTCRLQAAVDRHQGQGRRRDRLPVGQRRLRDARWAEDQAGVRTSSCWPTGAAFTDACGPGVRRPPRFGMGKRSQRYSMISTTAW